ncbi:XRE family transcriptional regulator [Eggerthellaceae bacterium zg-1084]|uniref:XRE family transcriptional regulator n=2 Tax=Berryella wangjianweii TaxID=2734634 RepID=A0A6M8J4P0_9ACTN|nr:XRE family transcriptional regulator [Berryella wangjianweii]NPD31729.1 XRE family transcriptional regulator [Eggerthellaceae bacterium zg-997]QKF08041.1 XRE family transcriptional regulator [Berryella wangjianweii]
MEEPLTEHLLSELLRSSDPACFAVERLADPPTLSAYLNELLNQKGLVRSKVVAAAGVNPTFGYQIFTGARRASRDVLLQLGFALGCDLRQMNRLLQAGGANGLYCKGRRDAIIIFGIDRGQSIAQVNESLYNLGEATIG